MNPPAPVTSTWVTTASPSAGDGSPPRGLEHLHHGAPEDPEIEPERPGVDVLAVELDDLLEVADRLVPVELPEPGDAGLHGQSPPVVRPIALDLVDHRGPRAHEAHFASEHDPELRQLVEMTGAKPFAERGDPRVVLDL